MAPAIPKAQSTHWCTPLWLVEAARSVMGKIHLDPCSNPFSRVDAECNYYLATEEMFKCSFPNRKFVAADGLLASWDFPTVWVNPPYGKGLHAWMILCHETHRLRGAQVMAIIPSATETKHFQDTIYLSAHAICYLKTRVKFEPNVLTPKTKDQPTRGHAVVYWGHRIDKFREVFEPFGHIEEPVRVNGMEQLAAIFAPCPECGWHLQQTLPAFNLACRCGKTTMSAA